MKITNQNLIVAAVVFSTVSSASAATFTVTNTLDDLNPGSLRWAITQANADPDFDTITFDIPSANPNDPPQPQTIQLTAALPSIKALVTIDGWSQVGEGIVGIEIQANSTIDTALQLDNGAGTGYLIGSIIQGLAINGAKTCINSSAYYVKIYGNYIGFRLDGETSLPCQYGIVPGLFSTIGGEGLKRNVINSTLVPVDTQYSVTIENNIIGMTASGDYPGNGSFFGIYVRKQHVIIRNNFISNSTGGLPNVWVFQCLGKITAICVERFAGRDVVIENNFINIGLDGKTAQPSENGIIVNQLVKDVVIKNNVISANKENGIYLFRNGASDGAASNIKILNNIIGLSSKGDEVVDQNGDSVIQPFGIHVIESDGMTIGPGNIVSGNNTGISVTNSGAVTIEGNTIGLGLDKTTPYPNQSYGVRIGSGAFHNIKNNVIAHNGVSGVGVTENADQVSILNNKIFNNTSLGIDLIPNGGVTLNDEGDADSGSNDLMNFPVLHEATYASKSNELTVKLSLDTPGTALVQFFANSSTDPSGHGEGETFLGEANVSPGLHTVKIQLPFSPIPDLLKNISATATVDNKTSEFSGILSQLRIVRDEFVDGEVFVEKWTPLKGD